MNVSAYSIQYELLNEPWVSVKRGPDTCGWRMRMGKCGWKKKCGYQKKKKKKKREMWMAKKIIK